MLTNDNIWNLNQSAWLSSNWSTTTNLWFSLEVIHSHNATKSTSYLFAIHEGLFHLIMGHLNHPTTLSRRKCPVGIGPCGCWWCTVELVNQSKAFQTDLSEVCWRCHRCSVLKCTKRENSFLVCQVDVVCVLRVLHRSPVSPPYIEIFESKEVVLVSFPWNKAAPLMSSGTENISFLIYEAWIVSNTYKIQVPVGHLYDMYLIHISMCLDKNKKIKKKRKAFFGSDICRIRLDTATWTQSEHIWDMAKQFCFGFICLMDQQNIKGSINSSLFWPKKAKKNLKKMFTQKKIENTLLLLLLFFFFFFQFLTMLNPLYLSFLSIALQPIGLWKGLGIESTRNICYKNTPFFEGV